MELVATSGVAARFLLASSIRTSCSIRPNWLSPDIKVEGSFSMALASNSTSLHQILQKAKKKIVSTVSYI